MSTSQPVNHMSIVNSGGSGEPVSSSAGVFRIAAVSPVGGGVRASAAAAPEASPIRATSQSTSIQNQREALSPLRRGISRARYQAPSRPMPPSSTALATMMRPYGVQSPSQPPRLTVERAIPDTATTKNAAIASDE